MDMIERECWHGYVWCPQGCHDTMVWQPDNAGVNLWLTLAEDLANNELSEFDAALNLGTMKDGLDEACELAVKLIHEEASDHGP